MIAVKKVIGIGLITLSALSLSGCGLIPPSDEQRYRLINEVKNSLDYTSAGEITKEGYDDNNGVFSPSIFAAQIKGESTFDTLSARIKEIPEIECTAMSAIQVRCEKGQVTIGLKRDSPNDSLVKLRLTDFYSGRSPDGN